MFFISQRKLKETINELLESDVLYHLRKFDREVFRKIDELFDRSKKLEEEIRLIKHNLRKDENQPLRDIFYHTSWLTSIGADLRSSRLIRYIPVKIYISDPVPTPEILVDILQKIDTYMEAVGFHREFEFPEEIGSWFKKIIYACKSALSSDEARNAFNVAETALILDKIKKPEADIAKIRAEADKTRAETLAILLKSIENISSSAVQLGYLLIVKTTDADGKIHISTHYLTDPQLQQIEQEPSLLNSPGTILQSLRLVEIEPPYVHRIAAQAHVPLQLAGKKEH